MNKRVSFFSLLREMVQALILVLLPNPSAFGLFDFCVFAYICERRRGRVVRAAGLRCRKSP